MPLLRNKPHALIIPYPAQGHIIPLLDLTHKLAVNGVSITILVTPRNLNLITPLCHKNRSIQTLVLPFPEHSSIPSGLENVKDLPTGLSGVMIHTLGNLHEPLVKWFNSHPSPPVVVISDMFMGWTHRLACQLGIRRIVFSPSGAMGLSGIYYLWRYMPEIGQEGVSFDKLPSSPRYPRSQISSIYRSYVKGNEISEFVKDGFVANIASWGLIINTFTELEREYLDNLKKEMGHDRVWTVGPLLPIDNDQSKDRGGSSSVSSDDIISWLDCREDRTVVLICFGSQAVLSNDQMAEVASALEKSGVQFLWCVKEPRVGHVDDARGMVPDGFVDRVAERGLVVKGWAPQVLILRHRAVGAFLTHCGWNSVMESVVAGVPLLAWPMSADQFLNATLLVDDLKVAKRVCEGANTVPDSTELARVLAESMNEYRVEGDRVKELQKAAFEATRESGGSSVNDLEELMKQLSGL